MRRDERVKYGTACVALFVIAASPPRGVLAQGPPPPPPEERAKYCVALYSHNFKRSNSNPIHYQYQWCDAAGKCTKWDRRSLKPGGQAFASRVQCFNTTRRVKMKIRYDWKFSQGVQNKSYDLNPQRFPYQEGRLPNSGCITRAAYHFVSRNGTLHLYSGEPKDVKRASCRWVDSK